MSVLRFFASLFLLSSFVSFGMAQTIVQEDFNSGIPMNWSVVDGGTTTDTWFGTTNGYFNNTLDGTEFAFVDSDAAGNNVQFVLAEELISPLFNGNAYAQVILEFDHYYRQVSTDTGFVEVFDGTSWVMLGSYTTDTGGWGMPDRPMFNLTPYLNANMRVRFRYMDNAVWAWFWAVDNVHIYAPLAVDAQLDSLAVPAGSCGLSTTEQISVEVHNNGINALSNFNLSYQVNGAGIITETVNTNLAAGNSLVYTFVIGANLSAAGPHDVVAWVSQSGDGDTSNDTLAAPTLVNHPQVTTFPYFEDFETSMGDWFASGTNVSWAWGTPAKDVIQGAASGTMAWVTGGLGTSNYNDNEQNQVESPCFDLSAVTNPWVGLDIWWNAEFSWDGAALQASSDGGQTWHTVGQFGDPYHWYTDNTIDGQPGGQGEGWTGRNATQDGSNGYRRAVHSLAAFAGAPQVILRFAFASDGTVNDDGVAFDNFTLAQGPSLYLGPDTVACESVWLDAGPAASYRWSTGDTTRFLRVDSSGIYTAEVRDGFGFPVADQIQVTILKTGDLALGPDTLLCGGGTYNLQADPAGSSFLWSTGATTPSLAVTNSGNYGVAVTYGPGCVDRDTVRLDFSALQAGISVAMDTFCTGTIVPFMDGSVGAGSWQWDFGDGNFSVNANPLHVYATGGTFLVKLVVSDSNCTEMASRLVFADVCTNIGAGVGSAGVKLAPNPAADATQLMLQLDQAGLVRLEVYDLQGRQVQAMDWMAPGGSSSQVIPLAEMARGSYLVRVQAGGQMYSLKLWIQGAQ